MVLPPLGRRAFLRRAGVVGGIGALALGAPSLLAACGSDGSASSGSSGDRLTLTTDLGGRQLVGLFNYTGGYVEAGTPQRLALAIASAEGPPEADGPATLTVQLARDGTDVGAPVTLPRHSDGTPIGYYPLVTTFDQEGTWTVATELDGQSVDQAFRVEPPGGSTIRQVGETMVPVETPTTTDARGVNPICTRSPQCPFHDQTLTQALAKGAPVALMISTPQFCQTGVCGPVLDLVIEQSAAVPRAPGRARRGLQEPQRWLRPGHRRTGRCRQRLRPVVRTQPVRGPRRRHHRLAPRQRVRPGRAGPGVPGRHRLTDPTVAHVVRPPWCDG